MSYYAVDMTITELIALRESVKNENLSLLNLVDSEIERRFGKNMQWKLDDAPGYCKENSNSVTGTNVK